MRAETKALIEEMAKMLRPHHLRACLEVPGRPLAQRSGLCDCAARVKAVLSSDPVPGGKEKR